MKRRIGIVVVVALAWSTQFLRAEELPTAFGGVQPRISPDGTRVAVSYQGGIWSFGLDDEARVVRQISPGEPWNIEPVWSPDGKRIAFWSTVNFRTGVLRIVDAETGEGQPLAKPIRGEGKLYFHPSGDRVLGILSAENLPNKVAWLDLGSGGVTQLDIGPEDPALMRRKRMKYALSPDGESIVYAVHRDEADEQGGYRGPICDLWRCAADGSGAVQFATWPARIYDLVFGGDDGLFVVTDLGTAHNDVWRLPLNGEPLKGAGKMTFGQADDDRPSIDSEGARMVWSDNSGGATAIRIKQLSSGQALAWQPKEFAFKEPTGTLKLRLEEVGAGAAVAGRVSIHQVPPRREGGPPKGRGFGPFHAPPGSMYRMKGPFGHFYVDADEDAELEVEVPAGDYVVQVRRGLEYRLAAKTVSVEAGRTADATMELLRWADPAGEGWWSGENHVHANYGYGEWYNTPATILRQCRGEGLNVCNAVIANSDGEAIFDREFFLGEVDPLSTEDTLMFWGQEFRATLWGHMTLSNLSQLVEPIMTGFLDTTNPWDVPTNADIAERVLEQTERGGAVVGYTHPAANRLDLYDQPYAAKGMPVDAALGRVALMDVMGHTYEGSVQLWYRLMNCGLPVVASSGTDVFLNRIVSFPPGWARTYVKLADGLDYRKWTAGQVAGRSFISSGPMLEFEVDGKLAMGGSVSLDAPGKLRVKASARSQFPMDRVELVRNGEVVESLEVKNADGVASAEFEGEIEIPESGWLALRAHGPAVPETVREPAAHSNPLWITVNGKPNRMAKTDAEFFLKWIDRLQGDFEKRGRVPNEERKRRVLQQLEKAREFYRGVRG